MLEQLEDACTIADTQSDAFVPGDHVLRDWQGRAQDKGSQIQALVRCGSRENALFFARRAKLDTVVTSGRRRGHDGHLGHQCNVRTLYGQCRLPSPSVSMLFADASAAIVPAAMATSPGGQVICFG
jgi:hypothetical protein